MKGEKMSEKSMVEVPLTRWHLHEKELERLTTLINEIEMGVYDLCCKIKGAQAQAEGVVGPPKVSGDCFFSKVEISVERAFELLNLIGKHLVYLGE